LDAQPEIKRLGGTLGRDPSAWLEPDFPSSIKTLPLPHATTTRFLSIASIAQLLFALAIILFIFIIPIANRGLSSFSNFEIAFAITMLLLLLTAGLYVANETRRERRFLTRRLRTSRWIPWLRALQTARIPFCRCTGDKAGAAFLRLDEAFAAESLERPGTLLDLRLAQQVKQIPLTDQFLEPEQVVPGSRANRSSRNTSIVIGALMLAIGLLLASPSCLVLAALFITIPLLSLRVMRRLAPDVRLGFGACIAGPGFLVANDELHFTCDRTICLIRSIGKARTRDPSLEVWFISSDAIRRLDFPSPLDPQFISLWQRWCHPDPRPSLAGSC